MLFICSLFDVRVNLFNLKSYKGFFFVLNKRIRSYFEMNYLLQWRIKYEGVELLFLSCFI